MPYPRVLYKDTARVIGLRVSSITPTAIFPPMFQVLHSGAGAGKTHALVKHYLAHCVRSEDPGAYRRVLALTFTNKAAGEMKERVLQYLERIAAREQGSAQIDDVVEHLTKGAGIDADQLAERAKATLRHMLHHWGDVAISTIDSFTRRVVRPFTRDLKLDHELRMTTEQDHYLGLAVDELIAQAGVEPTITGLLTEACLQLLDDERPWDPAKPLNNLSKELNKESSIGPLLQLATLAPERVSVLTKELRATNARFRSSVNRLGEEALATISNAGISEADMAHGKSGILGWFRKVARFEEVWDAPGLNALKPIEGGKWHSGKASARTQSDLEAISGKLTELFHAANELRNTGYKAFLIREAVAEELLTAYTLHALDEQLEHVKRKDGVTFFSDLTRKVAQVVKREPVPFIHERMGDRYRHYLIDEFQDTSLLQWNSLLPLIDEALGSNGSALLVGDAKQAIYRWRNGEVRLFRDLPRLFGRDPEDEEEARRERKLVEAYKPAQPLLHNYRSSATIVSFNNALFSELATTLTDALQPIYHGHVQQQRRQQTGYVHLQLMEPGADADACTLARTDFLEEAIRKAVKDGYAPGDVAVLVRTARRGAEAAAHILSMGFAVVSPDGLKLSGDPVIELLIDLLRFQYSGDATAAARVLQYQAMLHAQGRSSVDPFAHHGKELPEPAKLLRTWLRDHGAPRLRTTLSALVDQLARANGILPTEDTQVLTLLDEVHTWSAEHGQDLGGFLDYWDRRGSQRSISPPAHSQAVQVMTVHKAKGLEFPVVIMTDAQMIGARNDDRLWIDPRPTVPELGSALVRDKNPLRETAELPELQEEAALRTLDGLNLLYVAFTRPVQRLHALVPVHRTDVVTKALAAYVQAHGTDDRLVLGEALPQEGRKEASSPWQLHDVAGTDAFDRLHFRREAPEDWDPMSEDVMRGFGNAVHEVLALVNTPEELPKAIASVSGQGMLDVGQAKALEKLLGELLQRPALRPWFGPGLEIRNEATLITRQGKALRPDRVVFDGGQVRILDIKTGAPMASHHEQVRNYMHQLADMGHPNVEGALLYVRSGELEPVSA